MSQEPEWRFYEFRGPAARAGSISEWIKSEGPEIEDELRDMLDYLGKTEAWTRPEFGSVSGGLREIRWKSDALSVQVRVYGIFGPTRRAFTMLIGATKKTKRGQSEKGHKPKNAMKTARKRKKQVEGDWSLVEPFET